jgi:hypothetical protein
VAAGVATTSSILWRRLDVRGHDACRLAEVAGGWALDGVAAFSHEYGPAALVYPVACDRAWRTRRGSVHGQVGDEAISVTVRRTRDGSWTVNGAVVPGLTGCVDLDFGFTPATNLLQLRRIALEIGEARDVPVAWLDGPAGSLLRLEQRYERRGEDTYWYEAARFGYAARLEVAPSGFARRYPGLWEAESGRRG